MATPPLFDTAFLKKLEYLSLVSRRVFRGALLAQRRAMQTGSGIEFADHRQYTAAEDYRYLDWNVYARHDHLLVKRFEEEQDLHVYLLLDCSRSMAFGTPPKFDFARQVTAALAYIALADLDRVAVTAFAGEIVADFPLTRGKDRILTLLAFLEQLRPEGSRTNLAEVATAFVHRTRRRGLVVVVSDLFDPAGFEPGLDLLRHHRYELHVVQVHERGEADPRLRGDLELVNAETAARRKVTVTEQTLRRYRQLFTEYQESLRRYCSRYGVGCTQTASEVPFEDLVLRMMRVAGGAVR
jgi:uncharacterized protein (DUF58 family)